MIITHTINGAGHRRVYLGGKSSVECWIEPAADGVQWTFHAEPAHGAYPLPPDQMAAWAKHMLLALADDLGTAPADLKAVAFDRIAALHVANPADYHRATMSKKQTREHVFVAAAPRIDRPQVAPGDDFHRGRFYRR